MTASTHCFSCYQGKGWDGVSRLSNVLAASQHAVSSRAHWSNTGTRSIALLRPMRCTFTATCLSLLYYIHGAAVTARATDRLQISPTRDSTVVRWLTTAANTYYGPPSSPRKGKDGSFFLPVTSACLLGRFDLDLSRVPPPVPPG